MCMRPESGGQTESPLSSRSGLPAEPLVKADCPERGLGAVTCPPEAAALFPERRNNSLAALGPGDEQGSGCSGVELWVQEE